MLSDEAMYSAFVEKVRQHLKRSDPGAVTDEEIEQVFQVPLTVDQAAELLISRRARAR